MLEVLVYRRKQCLGDLGAVFAGQQQLPIVFVRKIADLHEDRGYAWRFQHDEAGITVRLVPRQPDAPLVELVCQKLGENRRMPVGLPSLQVPQDVAGQVIDDRPSARHAVGAVLARGQSRRFIAWAQVEERPEDSPDGERWYRWRAPVPDSLLGNAPLRAWIFDPTRDAMMQLEGAALPPRQP